MSKNLIEVSPYGNYGHGTPLIGLLFEGIAIQHLVLRKVGGGYIFVHRLLLEYFASLEPEEECG